MNENKFTFIHVYNNNKKNFFTECPTQVGQKCPICEEISELWKSDEGDNKARRTKIRKQVKIASLKPDVVSCKYTDQANLRGAVVDFEQTYG